MKLYITSLWRISSGLVSTSFSPSSSANLEVNVISKQCIRTPLQLSASLFWHEVDIEASIECAQLLYIIRLKLVNHYFLIVLEIYWTMISLKGVASPRRPLLVVSFPRHIQRLTLSMYGRKTCGLVIISRILSLFCERNIQLIAPTKI